MFDSPVEDVDPSEDIVRGIFLDKIDPAEGRVSPSVFVSNGGLSVSRLSIAPFQESWRVLKLFSEKPPDRILSAMARINVGYLQKLGKSRKEKITVSVKAKPLQGFPSHAEILEKITRGFANDIKKKVDYFDVNEIRILKSSEVR